MSKGLKPGMNWIPDMDNHLVLFVHRPEAATLAGAISIVSYPGLDGRDYWFASFIEDPKSRFEDLSSFIKFHASYGSMNEIKAHIETQVLTAGLTGIGTTPSNYTPIKV